VGDELLELMAKAKKAKVSDFLIADPGRPDFDDCCKQAELFFETKIHILPGSKNGKRTHLLHARTAV